MNSYNQNIKKQCFFKNIVLNIPHSSQDFPEDSNLKWDDSTLLRDSINRWTDFYTDKLFEPTEHTRDNVLQVIYPYSRFFCDVERLIGDDFENKGQGIIYSTTDNGAKRFLPLEEKQEIFTTYTAHIKALQDKLSNHSLLIDCHSFPSDLAPDVDICIGYNENWSKPDDETLSLIEEYLQGHGFRVVFNSPFCNSITPPSIFTYKSIMIEVNKNIYMHENDLSERADMYKVHFRLVGLYEKLLLNNKDKYNL
jgi:N-formylglutamate amidohydrolase